jgi:hypothetical protein
MPVIDMSGPIRDGMWYYGELYIDMPVPSVRVREVDLPGPSAWSRTDSGVPTVRGIEPGS